MEGFTILRVVVLIGLLLSYSARVICEEDCSIACLLDFDNATFLEMITPGYPHSYLQGTKQTWIAVAPSGEGMMLTVRDLDLGTGDVVKVGHNDITTYVFEPEDAGGLTNETFSFGPNEVLWVLFESDSDGSVGRGFWLTLMRDRDYVTPSAPSNLSTVPTNFTENSTLPAFNDTMLYDLYPAFHRHLVVSLPVALCLVLLAFGLGAAAVWGYKKRVISFPRASRGSAVQITLEMCENPVSVRRGKDVNRNSNPPDTIHEYSEIGEEEYNILFGNHDLSASQKQHQYQQLLKEKNRLSVRNSAVSSSHKSSMETLSSELYGELSELKNMIDDMLREPADDAKVTSPAGTGAQAEHQFLEPSADLEANGHGDDISNGQTSPPALPPAPRSRAYTGDFPFPRRSGNNVKVRSLRFKAFSSMTNLDQHATGTSRTPLETLKENGILGEHVAYGHARQNLSQSLNSLNNVRCVSHDDLRSSIRKLIDESDDEGDYSELEIEEESSYLALGATYKASSIGDLSGKFPQQAVPEYAVLENGPDDETFVVISKSDLPDSIQQQNNYCIPDGGHHRSSDESDDDYDELEQEADVKDVANLYLEILSDDDDIRSLPKSRNNLTPNNSRTESKSYSEISSPPIASPSRISIESYHSQQQQQQQQRPDVVVEMTNEEQEKMVQLGKTVPFVHEGEYSAILGGVYDDDGLYAGIGDEDDDDEDHDYVLVENM